MWTHHPKSSPKQQLWPCCFFAALLLSRKVLSVVLERIQKSVLHHLGISAYSCAWNSLVLSPTFVWLKPLQHSFTPPKQTWLSSGAIKRYGCLCSTATELCLEFMSSLCHLLVLMFIKLSSQKRPVPHSFEVLHFCLLGGGSSLQTCRS